MEAQKLLDAAPFGPEVLKILKHAFERASGFVGPTMAFGHTRLRLAHAIVAHACSGERDCEVLAAAALASLRKHSAPASAVTMADDVENGGTPVPGRRGRRMSRVQLTDRANADERFFPLWDRIVRELERDRMAVRRSQDHLIEIHGRLQRTRETMQRATELMSAANETGTPGSADNAPAA
jgi:hypothetical protein